MDLQAIWLSLKLASATTAILLVVGGALAYWIAFSNRRWKFLVEAVVAMPLILPPTVLGFYLLLAMGPRSPWARHMPRITGGMLPFSFAGLLIASVLYSLPFTVQPVAAAFAAWTANSSRPPGAWASRALRPSAAWSCRWRGPESARARCLSFAHTMGEFGVVLMVGGNIAGVTRTVSISIYDQVQALDYGAAWRTSLALLGFSFAALALTYALQRGALAKRRWGIWPAN